MSTLLSPNLAYKPLDPSHSEIRVIRFVPASPSDDASSLIQLALHHVSLDDGNLKYSALSYVWGDDKDTLPIIVDGVPFQATRNLVDALTAIRPGFGESNLWVDAICINQRDIPERNSQVPMMGRIYKQTGQVLVWLGAGDDKTRGIFSFIRVWSKYLIQLEAVGQPIEAQTQLLPLLEHVVTTALATWQMEVDRDNAGNEMDLTMTWLDVFQHRTYWERCWTFQELYLPDEGVFICGNDIVVGLSEVFQVFSWMYLYGPQIAKLGKPAEMSNAVWRFFTVCVAMTPSIPMFSLIALRLQAFMNVGSDRQVEVLLHTRLRKATNPRDRFYGVMGLVDLDLKIDYGAPVEEVYTDAAQMLTRGGGKMLSFLLSNAGVSTRPVTPIKNIPSWASGWEGIETLFLKELFTRNCNAAAGLSDQLAPKIIDGFVMEAHGVVIDTVVDVARRKYWSDPEKIEDSRNRYHAAWMDDSIEFFFNCSSESFIPEIAAKRSPYVGGGTKLAALMRFWMQDHVEGSGVSELESFHDLANEDPNHPKLLQVAKFFLAYMLFRERDISRMSELRALQLASSPDKNIWTGVLDAVRSVFSHGTLSAPACQETSFLHSTESETASTTWDDLLKFVLTNPGRKAPSAEELQFFYLQTFTLAECTLVRTENGYIGVGRPGIELGDVICVLAGSEVPVILRPVEDGKYELVSYAFMVGLMHGEAWELVMKDEKKVNKLEIC